MAAFTLDTSVVQAAGFRFTEGALRRLGVQLPPWLQLWISDIVLQEISGHRLARVDAAVQQIRSGAADLQRHLGRSELVGDVGWLARIHGDAVNAFDEDLHKFIERHRGLVLEPNFPRLGMQLFRLYFQGLPPFADGKDKKHEFPDAAALLTLEHEAKQQDIQVIAVSKDEGWKAYAKQSDRIYCVGTLEELTSLFVSSTPQAKAITRSLRIYASNASKEFLYDVRTTITRNLASLPWRISVPVYYGIDIDVGVVDAKLRHFEVNADAIGVWVTSAAHDECVAEVSVSLEVALEIELFAYRRQFDGSKTDLHNSTIVVDLEPEIKLVLEMRGRLATSDVAAQIARMSLGEDPIAVTLKHGDLGIGFERLNPWDDDVPF